MSQMSMLSSNALLTIWKSSVCRLNTIIFFPYSDGHDNLGIGKHACHAKMLLSWCTTGLKRHSYAELIVIHMKTTSATLLP